MIRKYGTRLFVVSALAFCAAQIVARDNYWIPHVTKAETGILTEIVVNNDNLNQGSVWLWAPDQGSSEIVVPPKQMVIMQADLLFPGGANSIRLDATLGLDLWVRYSGKALSEPLTVPLAKEGQNYYRFEQARQPSVWQGLALVNISEEPATASISYFDAQRRPTGGSVLVEELGRYGKYSTILANPRELVGQDGWFEIHSDQPVIAVVLSGGPSQDGIFTMYHHQPQARSVNQVRFTMTGGFGGDDFALTLTPEKVCTETGFCMPTSTLHMDTVLSAMDRQRILETRVPNPTQPCPDAFVMEVEIYWNGVRNAFSFHDCSEGVPQEARDFVMMLRQLREDIQAQ